MLDSNSPTKRNNISKFQGQPLQKRRSKYRSGPILLIIFGTSFVWVLVDLIILLRFIDTGEGVGFGRFGPIGQKNDRELRDKGGEEQMLDTLHRGPGDRGERDRFKDINGMDKADALEYIRRAKLKENLEGRIKNLGEWLGLQKKQVKETVDEIAKMAGSDRNGGKVKGEKGQGHLKDDAKKETKKELSKKVKSKHDESKDDKQKKNEMQKEKEKEKENEKDREKEKEKEKEKEEETRKATKKEKKKEDNAPADKRVHFIDPQGNEVFGEDDERPANDLKEPTPMNAEAIAKFQEEKQAALRARVDAEWKRKQAHIANMIVMAGPEDEKKFKELEKKKKAEKAKLELRKQQAFEIEMQQKLKERLKKENEGEERERQEADAKAKRLKGKTEKDYYHIHGVVPVPYEPDYKPKLTELEKRAQRDQLGIDKVINYDVTTFKRNPDAPGERGTGIQTSDKDRPKVKAGWKEAEFNQYASDQISVERSVRDARYPERVLEKA